MLRSQPSLDGEGAMTKERPSVEESSRGWSAVREGQSDTECRKTCGRGAKLTEILGMGYSTPKSALRQGSPACRRNGCITQRVTQRGPPEWQGAEKGCNLPASACSVREP